MKFKKLAGLSVVVAMIFAAGCGAATSNVKANKVVDESQLGYSDAGTPPKVEYSKAAPGTSKRFQRSYENAPPLIPHNIEGLVPITLNRNACLDCHLPSVAKSVGATPIPPTHFKDFFKAGKEKIKNLGNVKIHMSKNDIAPQRYNCVQCHVPQANAKPLVKNTFKPYFRKKENMHRSTLNDQLFEGAK
jgi:cytochrome c-type protein NapB